MPPGSKRNRESRAAELLLQPRRHKSDDTGMPAFRRGDHHRPLLFQPERRQRLGFRFGEHVLFHRSPLVIQPVEFGRNPPGLGRILLK